MENLNNLLKGGDYKSLKEKSEEQLIIAGYIFTKAFRWITQDEADWLNKRLDEVNFGKTVEELYGVPSYETEITETKKVGNRMETFTRRSTKIYPFVFKFYEMRTARELDAKNRIQSSML